MPNNINDPMGQNIVDMTLSTPFQPMQDIPNVAPAPVPANQQQQVSPDDALVNSLLEEMKGMYNPSNEPSTNIENEIRSGAATGANGYTGSDYVRGLASSYLDSFFMGFSDEAAAAFGYLAAEAEGLSGSEAYDYMKQYMNAEREKFAAENPKAALGATIGGFLSPVGVSGAIGKLPGMAGSVLTRAGVEGTVYGAGSGEGFWDTAEKAFQGGAVGLAVAGGIQGIARGAKGLGTMFSKSVPEELSTVGAAGEEVVKPITSVTEPGSFVHSLYRDVLIPSFPGGPLRASEIALKDSVQLMKERTRQLANVTTERAASRISLIRNDLRASLDAAKANTDSVIAKIKSKGADNVSDLDIQRRAAERAEAQRLKDDFDNQVDEIYDSFTASVFEESLPSNVTQESIMKVMNARTHGEGANVLNDLWKTNGFSSLNQRTFWINPNQLKKDLISNLDSMRLTRTTRDQMENFIGEFTSELKALSTKGTLNGSDMGLLRSRVSEKIQQYAAGGTVSPTILRNSFTASLRKLDEALQRQMTPEEVASFASDKIAWGNWVRLREATQKANRDALSSGRITPQHWINTLENRELLGLGADDSLTALARKQANVVNAGQTGMNTTIRNAGDAIQRSYASLIKTERSKMAKLIKDQRQQLVETQNGLRTGAYTAEEVASHRQRLDFLLQKEQALNHELERLNKILSQSNPTWFHKMAANKAMMNALSAVVGTGTAASAYFLGPTATALGIGGIGAIGYGAYKVGQKLVSPGGQKFMAGQTSPQRAAQRLFENNPNLMNNIGTGARTTGLLIGSENVRQ